MSDATTAPRKKLVLVDAYSLLFRAFFSARNLSTSDNRPTGALYGFANMIFAILNNEKPDALIICWDAHEQTLRSQEFEAYKAHRPEIDPQLRAQMPVARDLIAAFGIHSAEVGGYEADDLIGTLAMKGNAQGYSVVILTGDSDQLQLVVGNIKVHITQRGVTEVKIYDTEAVRERYGILPERIPDWKGLVGDTSDNIPGVPGIGEKTATALLQQFDSMENLLDHISEVTPPKARASLEANAEQARFSKRLATIVCDVPAELEIYPYSPTDADWQRLRELFADLEFRTLMARIPRISGTEAPEVSLPGAPTEVFQTAVTLLSSEAELEAAIAQAKQSGKAALFPNMDTALPMRAVLHGIAFASSPEAAYYVPVRLEANEAGGLGGLFGNEDEAHSTESDAFCPPLSALAPLLEDPAIAKYGHNVKVIEILLERAGLHPTPFVFDTQIAAYLLNSGRSAYPLMDLAENHLGVRLEVEDIYAPQALAIQAAVIVGLVAPMQAKLAELGMTEVMERVEMPLIPALAAVEQTGVLMNTDYLRNLADRMARDAEALAQEVYTLAGEEFNIGSTKQLQTILFDKLQLPTGKKIKTGFSTGADLLEQLAPQYEICRKIIDYREVTKLKSTYADALPKLLHPVTGRLHTSLHQTVASTGRLSSSDPNLQNIPIRSEIGREIRRAFIAPSGKLLLSCDYSQIELRLLAHITNDPALMEAFLADADVHAATAATVFGVPLTEVSPDQRRQAKTINFAVIYGQSGFSLAAALGVDTSTATRWIKEYFERLPGVKQYIEETKALAHAQKYVSTLMGRRRYMPELESSNHNMRQFAERAAVNMPIQGTAADIIKLAMSAVHNVLQAGKIPGCTMLLQVHDELLFEVEESAVTTATPQIVALMEAAYPLSVHLRADAKVGTNWSDMKAC